MTRAERIQAIAALEIAQAAIYPLLNAEGLSPAVENDIWEATASMNKARLAIIESATPIDSTGVDCQKTDATSV